MTKPHRSHLTIWIGAGLIAALAGAVVVLRALLPESAPVENSAEQSQEQNALVNEMLQLLEKDPRVRRAQTRRLVDRVSTLAGDHAQETAEVYYALGLRLLYGESNIDGAEWAFTRAVVT